MKTDIPDGKWSVCDDVAERAWEFGVFAAIAAGVSVREAADWYRANGADLDTCLMALKATPREWLHR